ncbi:flagellar hook-associated protein FlgL [Lacticigenium naphthae]|uniref:flagellar hook-associated protein FlgL n=1 Tax=Lacticigenium naphthae TaxID=515351 RepID=UPI000412728D|nr:flagellar hook-associated protein FlgL [Lacticigenium naphthae]
MRVTSSYMTKNYLRNLNRNTQSVQKYQEQLSTLNKINRTSDDPLTASKIMDLKSSITRNEEYLTTIDDAIDWTNVQDSALSNATKSMQRISTLIQSAANGTMSDGDRQAVKSEVESEIGTLVDSYNTNFGGRYIFAGKETLTKPFEITEDADGNFTGIEYKGTMGANDSGLLEREIAQGVSVELQTDGRKLVGDPADSLGNFLQDVLTALDESDTEALGGDLMDRASVESDTILSLRTKIGATYNRLETSKARNESENLNLQSMLSGKQDIDLAETFMNYQMEMTSYEASLQMGTRILQTNILNYL